MLEASIQAVERSEGRARARDRVANALRKESNCHASQVMDGRSRLDRRDLDLDRTGTVGPAGIEPVAGRRSEGRIEETPGNSRPAEPPKPPDSHFALIKLNLLIADLGQQGCDVEVKPANAGCKFRVPSVQHITSEGKATFELKDVEIRTPIALSPWRSPSESRDTPPRPSIAASG